MTTTTPTPLELPETGGAIGAPADEASHGRRPPGTGRVLGTVVGSHAVVDYYSFIIVALLPLLATRLDLSNRQKAYVLAVGSIASGFVQPWVAWLGDRVNSRAIATIGLVVAACACSIIGLAQNFWQVMVLTAVAAGGVGAFHPPAAAVVGQLSGSRRSLGVSLFFLAGMGGGMLGNVLTPYVVLWFGMLGSSGAPADEAAAIGRGLAWQSTLAVPGLLVAVALARAIHRAPHRPARAHEDHAALPESVRHARWRAVWLLYAMSVTRFIVNNALVYLFVRWIELYAQERHGGVATPVAGVGIAASVLNGKFQAAMQMGMGGAGLAAGWLLAKRHEKLSLILVPLVGAVAITAVPWVDDLGVGHGGQVAVGLVLAVLAGVGFGGTVPTVIAMAQRLLPHRTALASGLMMGGAWGFGFIGPPAAERIEAWVSLDGAFVATGALLVVCAGLSAALPGRVLES